MGKWHSINVKNWLHLVEEVRKFTEPRPLEEANESAVSEVNRRLFRGVSDDKYELKPSLCRIVNEWQLKPEPEYVYKIECAASKDFKQRLQLYESAPRQLDDHDSWDNRVTLWQKMQHYGAPTRLLDWTASPYVAAYFAARESFSKDGAIYMVDYGALADRMTEQLPSMEIGTEPNRGCQNPLIYFRRCDVPDRRMFAQQGWTSCCNFAELDHGEVILKAFQDTHTNKPGHWARKIIISKEAKPAILRELFDMNIRGESLFPDLQGLGMSCKELAPLLVPHLNDDGSKTEFRYEGSILSRYKRGNTS